MQFSGHRLAVGRLCNAEAAGADIQRGVAEAARILPDSRQQVILTLVQQRFIADGARRHDAYDFALDRTFTQGRIADLFANRYRLAQLYQPGQIVFYGMIRHARHRYGFTGGGAAFCQGDIEQLRGAFRVIIKQLVEIPHAVEQQDVRMLRLQPKVLLHHWRVVTNIHIC